MKYQKIWMTGVPRAQTNMAKQTSSSQPSLKRVFEKLLQGHRRSRRLNEATGKLKPEFEKIVQKYAQDLSADSKRDMGLPTERAEKLLRNFAHELEKAEGEDPKELDPNGPPAGSSGPGEGHRDPTKGFNGGGDL